MLACCGSRAWAKRLQEARPFATFDALLETSDDVWAGLSADDRREAFAAHPADRRGRRLGVGAERASRAAGSSDEILRALEAANREYEGGSGTVFLINATGRSAREMLDACASASTTTPRPSWPRRPNSNARSRGSGSRSSSAPWRRSPARRMMPTWEPSTHAGHLDRATRRRRRGRAEVMAGGGWEPVGAGLTDEDGTPRDLLPEGTEPMAATYRSASTRVVLRARGVETFYPAVTVEFSVSAPGEHHHVPLLLSPFGYSTYRGT